VAHSPTPKTILVWHDAIFTFSVRRGFVKPWAYIKLHRPISIASTQYGTGGRMRYIDYLKRTASHILAAILFLFADAVAAQAGTLDATWASASPLGAGKVMTPIGGSNDSARAIALQSDRKVLVAGACYSTAHKAYKLCVLRYNANGTPDIDWNGSGTVVTPMGNSFHDHVSAITQQSDGKVLVAGDCYTGYAEFCTVRYHANGTLDTNWNGTGTVRTSIDGGGDFPDARATAMALQPDDKVLLAGAA
jgi:uncharacterized delta-60 repeat protein